MEGEAVEPFFKQPVLRLHGAWGEIKEGFGIGGLLVLRQDQYLAALESEKLPLGAIIWNDEHHGAFSGDFFINAGQFVRVGGESGGGGGGDEGEAEEGAHGSELESVCRPRLAAQ